jgi:hypothetical protein
MMRKLTLSIGAIALTATAVFVWSHAVLVPVQASPTSSITPIEMMTAYKGFLPAEQWSAI